MGREPLSAAATTSTTVTQVIVWAFFCCAYGFPQPPSQLLPVRYPGEYGMRNRMSSNSSRPEVRMVVFPEDEMRNALSPPLDMTGNPSCALSTSKAAFCENVDHYPTNEIRRLIKIDKASFQELFGPVMGVDSRRTINTDDVSEESVCKHQRQTFFPKMAKNNQNLWRYVINDVDYVQAVEAEVCLKEGKACSYVQDSLPGGHQSICRQRFSFKRLLAIDPDEKKTYLDSFRFASCCSCYVKVPAVFGRANRGKSTTQFPYSS